MRHLYRNMSIVLLLGACLSTQSHVATAQNCIPERGWFVRILPHQTEAPGVRIEIGFGGVGASHTAWREWRHGQPAEFPVPSRFLHANELWIKGISLEEDKNVAMCLGFNDHITKQMCFDEDEEHERSRDNHDSCNCD